MGRKTEKGLLRGAKFSNRHSTVIPAAIPIIKVAKALASVEKVVLSTIRRVPPGEPRIKFDDVLAGLRVTIRGSAAHQILFVYTSQPQATKEALEQAWDAERR